MAQISSLVKWLIALGVGAQLLTVMALLMETNPPVIGEPAWDSPQTRVLPNGPASIVTAMRQSGQGNTEFGQFSPISGKFIF